MLTQEGSERHEQGQIGALEAIVAAQDRHREEQGRYAPSVEELAGFGGLSVHGLPSYFGLELAVTGEGWAARVGMTGGWQGYPEPPDKGSGLRVPGVCGDRAGGVDGEGFRHQDGIAGAAAGLSAVAKQHRNRIGRLIARTSQTPSTGTPKEDSMSTLRPSRR